MSMTTIVPEERSDELAGHLGDGGSHLSVVRTGTDELISRLGELAAHIHAAQAELIDLLAQLDACQGWHGVGLRSIGHWASIELGIDARTATAQTHAGHLLASLPAIAAAARAGELGWDKIKLLARVVEPASETRWLDLAREMSVGQLARVVAAYRRASDDHPDDHDRARRRRGIWLFDEPDGLVRVTALLEPDDAAILRAALAAHLELLWRNRPTTPNPAPEPNTTTGPNTTAADSTDAAGADRTATTTAPADPLAEPQAGTASQPRDNNGHHVEPATPSEVDPTLAAADPLATRRVDALVSLARTALAQPGLPDLADDTTQTILHIDHDLLTGHNDVGHSHYANGPSVPVPTARRLCCDTLLRPLIHTPNGQPLTLGRATRTPNRAQRRALRHRDRGCTFPGCQSRYWLDAHHITHWADGGSTDLDNLTLLCRHHHRLHHEGAYTITMVAGRPHFHRPDGTEIRPPTPPPHPRSTRHDPTITRHTPRARAGGAADWSLPHTLDGLLN